MGIREVDERYFGWLKNMVGGKSMCEGYSLLLERLFAAEFTPVHKRDDARANDGRALRERFTNRKGGGDMPLGLCEPCRMLELMVALAMRIEFELDGFEDSLRLDDAFWRLINNLGMREFYDGDRWKDEFDEKMHILMSRRYSRNGRGGLFPLRRPKRDQRTTEIWYQMMEWLEENFEIG